MPKRPITAVVVGAGNRGTRYASYALQHPDRLKIVGVAEPFELRRNAFAEGFGLPPAQRYESAEEVAERPRMADVVINTTMDSSHVSTSLPLLAAGLRHPAGEADRHQRGRDVAAIRRRQAPRTQDHGLPRFEVRAFLPGHPRAGRQRRHRGRHEHPDQRARQLSPYGRRLRQGEMAQPRRGRLHDADGKVLPRPRPHHVDEERR